MESTGQFRFFFFIWRLNNNGLRRPVFLALAGVWVTLFLLSLILLGKMTGIRMLRQRKTAKSKKKLQIEPTNTLGTTVAGG